MPIQDDPRFTKLPENLSAQIKVQNPTGIMFGDTWHEVQFTLDSGIIFQCAVVNGEYVPMSKFEIAKITGIREIMTTPILPVVTAQTLKDTEQDMLLHAKRLGPTGFVLSIQTKMMGENPELFRLFQGQCDHAIAGLQEPQRTNTLRAFMSAFILLYLSLESQQRKDNNRATQAPEGGAAANANAAAPAGPAGPVADG